MVCSAEIRLPSEKCAQYTSAQTRRDNTSAMIDLVHQIIKEVYKHEWKRLDKPTLDLVERRAYSD